MKIFLHFFRLIKSYTQKISKCFSMFHYKYDGVKRDNNLNIVHNQKNLKIETKQRKTKRKFMHRFSMKTPCQNPLEEETQRKLDRKLN